jgi:subtilisin-like proprotein convertase family protein
MPFPKAIITKPFLVSDAEYKDLGLNINLVGYDSFSQVVDNTTQHASPKLLNWVEPYEISGIRKTLFYTEINTNFQVGDRVYILNGNYDNDSLIAKDKYKKGRDGYKVLKVDQCKVILDIDYTGVPPYNDDSFDDYIKVYYIDNTETFLNANRQVTTRGGNFDYKFNYYQNNIAFIDENIKAITGWGLNAGVTKTPGFFVRKGRQGWTKISDELVYLGSFSVALSPTYKNNDRMTIMDGSFTYNGIQFKEGFTYKWTVGPTSSAWKVDPGYSTAIITKSNFRNGTFNGKFNNGLYGTQQQKLDWTGKGTFNGGSIVNTLWKTGTINSKIGISTTYKATFDEYGIPFQKSYTNNNGGFGFNYIFDSEIEKSVVNNGNFYNTSFKDTATFSVVENHILSVTYSLDNRITKAYFDLCKFSCIQIDGGEIKNSRVFNSRISNSKSINSYFDQSVIKDSTYVSDKIVKVLGYDEWNMSEYFSSQSAQSSSIKDVNSKIYKFYISKESFRRMKTEDVFYIKGLKIKNSPTLTDFFDSKFRLTSWNEFYDDYSTGLKSITGVEPYSFYKRGYECAAFLSTPEENAYIINSYESLYNASGATLSKYTTILAGKNTKAAYSIDIIVSRHDLVNKNQSLDSTSEWDSLNPMNYNYSSDVIIGTTSLPQYLGSNIDITNAYILDSDFNGGIIETSDWNSGHHVNYNNDVVITSVTSSGIYNMEIDNDNDYLIANTNLVYNNPEKIGKDVISKDDIVFLNSIDYDTRGMVTKITLVATGSSYSATSNPISLINTKVSSLTMSLAGTYYRTGSDLITSNVNGKGTGLTLDITARGIGSVIGITYSSLSGGGSYSMNLISSIPTSNGPIASGGSYGVTTTMPPSFVTTILTDDALGTVTGILPSQNGGVNATYSTFGPPLTPMASGASGIGVLFVTGPITTGENGATSSPISLGSGLTLTYNTSSNGAITSLFVDGPGIGYETGQVFQVDGGNATFSITSVGLGEITSYNIKTPGEDYLNGDVLEIINPIDPNFQFGKGLTASVIVTSITMSNSDTKGLTLEYSTGAGGQVTGITISTPGLYYNEGDIFTINDGNLNALVRIDSVNGSVIRLNDTYKVIENERGRLTLKDLGKTNIIAGLTAYGIFYTTEANNRWGYISKTKIDRTKIKSGIFKRAYITNSLIRDIDYDSTDKDFMNFDKVKNLVISDSLFSNNSNILSSATYLYSSIVGGTDIWNDGIINKSIVNGLTFSKGTVKQSTWINGNFTGGMFYNSKSFDAMPTIERPNYLSNRVRSYYMIGKIGPTMSNNRYSWRNGNFTGGQFYKSDWENGVMDNGLLFYSKFYGGIINGGKIGTKEVAATDTRIYNGQINYTTVDNASVYSEDTSYTGLSSSSILWVDGVFNNGIFGSNNDDVLGTTFSKTSYKATIGSLPIADYKITTVSQNITDPNAILGDFEIDVNLTLKHTYLGDLIINLMSPNGNIINLKKRYSCGGNDNLLSTIFTSDSTKPSIEIGTAPYTGEFKFDALPNQGVYYDLNNKLLPNIAYNATENIIPAVIDYRSQPPVTVYESDRYLVIATASDPNWVAPAAGVTNPWAGFVGKIVERSSSNDPNYAWELYSVKNNDKVFVKNKSEYLKYIETSFGFSFNRFNRFNLYKGWVKSYHSNVSKISELMNTDKTVTGTWTLMVMDCAALDSGFVEDFEITFNYKTSYVIKSYKNDAVWYNGIFNGGQFIDLGVWKDGKFNGGKFISTYGYEKSGSYLLPSANISEYSWQAGEFNGGEFGNESLLSNSTWFNGEFNGGVFKGKLWNNGVFTYGEFKGGSSVPAIGNGIKSANAQIFIDSFKGDYYGVWRNGVVSDKKDNFVTDKKIFTEPVRAMAPKVTGKSAKFTNMLWVSGTFDHPSGELNNSVWLNGLFKMGKFQSSAFNPYVKRKSDKQEFVKDDSCIWENGKLIDSEFHMSKWKYGHFISGTAVGMIWQDGISNYMNAHNVFWEKGVWRNGNWYGSNFEYRGIVEDGMSKEILNRGIEWSGTSSCHIWNIFESDVDTTLKTVTTSISLSTDDGGDSFATNNLEDSGASMPSVEFSPTTPNTLGSLSTLTVTNATTITATFRIVTNGGAPITHAGFIYKGSSTPALAAQVANHPSVSILGGLAITNAGTGMVSVLPSAFQTATYDAATLGIPTQTAFTYTFTISGLNSTLTYAIQAFAVNNQCDSNTGAAKSVIKYQQTAQANDVVIEQTYLNPGNLNTGTGELYTGGSNVYVQSVLKPITLKGTYLTNTLMPDPGTTKGFVYVVKDISDNAAYTPTISDSAVAGTGASTIINGSITGLPMVANKRYHIRAYTLNSGGYGYSPVVLRITSGAVNPEVTLNTIAVNATDITGNVVTDGGSTTDLERGFIIRSGAANNTLPAGRPSEIVTTAPTSWAASSRLRVITNMGGAGTFTQQINMITGLEPGINYQVIAYAYKKIPSAGAAGDYTSCNAYDYSPTWTTFTAAPSIPTVESNSVVSAIGFNSATAKGKMVKKNGEPITSYGIVWTTDVNYTYPSDPATAPGYVPVGTAIADGTQFTAVIPSVLTSGQQYYFRAFAKNGIGVSYGAQEGFMTLPEIGTFTTTTTATSITPVFTVTGTSIGNKGIIWSTSVVTSPNYSTATNKTLNGPSDLLTSTPTTLIPNTKYFVTAYASNTDTDVDNTPKGTSYTSEKTVYTTPAFVAGISVNHTVVESTGFTVSVGLITPVLQGLGTNLSERGVLYGTTSPAATPVAHTTTTSLSAYSISIQGLSSGTKYYYRPYAKNDSGNQIGYYGTQDIQVTTLVGLTLPNTPSTSISWSADFINIGVTGDMILVSNAGNEPISGYGYCFNKAASGTVQVPDNTNNAVNTAITTAPPNFLITIPATLPTTGQMIYKIRVYMQNAGGCAYSKTVSLILNDTGILLGSLQIT